MQNSKYTQWITKYIKKYWYLLGALIILSVIAVGFELISPLPLKFLADNVFGNQRAPSFIGTHSKSTLLLIASLAYVGIYIAQSAYVAVQALISRVFNQIIDKATLNEAYEAASVIDYNDNSRLEPGTYLYQVTNQSQQMSEYLFSNIVPIFQSLLTLIGIIIILARIDLRIMLITFATMPLLAITVLYFGKKLENKANETELAHAKVYSFINDSMTKLRTIQAFALGKKRRVQLSELVDKRNKRAVQQLITSEAFDLTTQVIIIGGIAIAIYLGGHNVFAGVMTFGDLLIFISYINDVFDSVNNVISNIGSMKTQAAALQQTYDTISNADKKHGQSGTLRQPIRGEIEFRGINITHGTKKIIENVNLAIAPGSVVAFVGLSGGGKTTLLNSILRFVTPDRGMVLIDGHDIRDYDLNFLRQNIALIDQEPDLFELSILDNIAVAEMDRAYNLPDVMGAAFSANSTEFIASQPQGYETVVDNDALSGGQKQRIAIARAFYKKAPIILMDEPTSALDKQAATVFINNMFTYLQHRTVLIITHDLTLLKQVPTIYVVKDHAVVPISELGGLEAYSRLLSSDQP
jgi:ABC-type multidrug transport system fused ATPase/permease subunit